MQLKTFTIHANNTEEQEEVNKFLRSHRVLTVDRQFSAENGGCWFLLVLYQESGAGEIQSASRSKKVDYRELLSPEEFGRFAKFREIRKEIASKQGIPAYAVFTDEELSQMAKMDDLTISSISSIKGIGNRAEKFGASFLVTENVK